MGTRHGTELTVGRRACIVLGVLVALLAAGTVAGAVALRPDPDVVRATRVESPYAGLQLVTGEVVGTRLVGCEVVTSRPGDPPAAEAAPSGPVPAVDPAAADCALVTVQVGASGLAEVPVPVEAVRAGMRPGDPLRLVVLPGITSVLGHQAVGSLR